MTTVLFIGVTVAICVAFLVRRMLAEEAVREIRDEAIREGLIEPASLHPVIDSHRCIGCASCIDACPEKNVLGLVEGRAELIQPANCIGHGACKEACPPEAIELVFGTARRGVDIPLVDKNFQTDVPGVFIAGELGGMGLIRNAVEQGRQAMGAIGQRATELGVAGRLDVLVVGAGPAGIAALLAAKQQGLDVVGVEQESLGGTVAQYPRGKLVMTSPVELPLVGKMPFREVSKEKLLAYWQEIEASADLNVHYRERLENIEPIPNGLHVVTSRATYEATSVLLCIGRRGTPRKLGVPGEEQSKVVYRMIDPEQYAGRAVLVVGGGDSALEAAAEIAEQPGTDVTISYRSAVFSRAKGSNRERVQKLADAGRLRMMLGSTVAQIDADAVVLQHGEKTQRIANDDVIVCAGGILPTPFLKSMGVRVETKHGVA